MFDPHRARAEDEEYDERAVRKYTDEAIRAFVASPETVIDFEVPPFEGDRQMFPSYTASGVTFTASSDGVTGIVKNKASVTSACVPPAASATGWGNRDAAADQVRCRHGTLILLRNGGRIWSTCSLGPSGRAFQSLPG